MKDSVLQRAGLTVDAWRTAPPDDPTPVESGARPPAAPLPPIDVVVRGDVPHAAIPYAHNKLVRTMSALEEPVLHARLKLTMLPDPAVARPAVAEAILDVNGGVVRAHVAGRTTTEAADVLERRLRNRLEHAPHALDRGASVPSVRPSYCDRPVQEREVVRHKTFTLAESTVEEAISDMEVLEASTRKAAVDQSAKAEADLRLEAEAAGPGLREWFESLGRFDGKAAAFDTRIAAPAALTGRASKGIAKRCASTAGSWWTRRRASSSTR